MDLTDLARICAVERLVWADCRTKHNALERGRKAIRALYFMDAKDSRGMTAAAATEWAESHTRYVAHLDRITEAETHAILAGAKFDNAELDWKTAMDMAATRRAEMKIL